MLSKKSIKINELTGKGLLYAVLISIGYNITKEQNGMFWCMHDSQQYINSWLEEYPSITTWEYIIPFIEKNKIEYEWVNKGTRLCATLTDCNGKNHYGYGKDYIESTLKCLITNFYGEYIEIPQEFLI